MINNDILARSRDLSRQFQSAKPFKHFCVDGFLEAESAEKLLSDFPTFDAAKAVNEFGNVGKKSAHSSLRDISAFYSGVYEYLLSDEFLDAMSAMTGIPGLLPDPRMYGGGTHENRHGQGMDPHVDFNYDQDHGYHRRLNLIVYLNKEWDESWGGAIELHSKPRDQETNQVIAFNCLFNRAIVFETNEYSWHGFERVTLPESEKGRSRKSLSIYLYTKERPSEEIAPPHGTFYVPRPIPCQLDTQKLLSESEVFEITSGLRKRDNWITFYQKLELELSGQLQSCARSIESLTSAIKAPTSGPVLAVGKTSGLYHDGWIAPNATFAVRRKSATRKAILRGYLPESVMHATQIDIRINGETAGSQRIGNGAFTLDLDIQSEKDVLDFVISSTRSESHFAEDGDAREKAFVLTELEFLPDASSLEHQAQRTTKRRWFRWLSTTPPAAANRS